MTDLAPRTTRSAPNPRRWRILGMVGIAQLMLILDVTVVAIALPQMGSELGLARDTLTWVVSGYTLTFGGLLLLGGRAVDVFGARRLILLGLVIFAAGSAAAGLADSGATLLTGRVAQGVAAALLSPAALSLVVTIFEGEERNRALGIWSALGGSGAALGVLLGGLLTAGPGWPWVFFVNVPVAALLLAMLARELPAEQNGTASAAPQESLDLLGALLATAGTAALIYAVIRSGEHGWASSATLGLIAASVVLYLAFVVRQRTSARPLMDLGLLARRPVAVGTFFIMIATALMIAVFFLGTFYLQNHRGMSAWQTGLLFLPVAIATMAGANAAGRAVGSVGARRLGVLGLLIASAGMTVPALISGTTPLIIGVSIAASGTGVMFVVASATALSQVAPQEAGITSGIVSTFHEFGASLGAAVVSSVAATSIAGDGTEGYDRAFAVGAITALVAAAVAVVVTPRPTDVS